MKVGATRPSLSERLSARTASDDQAAASIAPIPTCSRTACADLLSNALNTIVSDTEAALVANRRALSDHASAIRADLNMIRRLTRFAPWTVATAMTAIIGAAGGASWFWTKAVSQQAKASALREIGITPWVTRRGTVFLVDSAKLTATPCRVADQTALCLEPRTAP